VAINQHGYNEDNDYHNNSGDNADYDCDWNRCCCCNHTQSTINHYNDDDNDDDKNNNPDSGTMFTVLLSRLNHYDS